ncbi:class I SAM-dependent methyltransferase [Bdellovibrio svalbardensis]|uniref:Methyltransferase domain-containing protein n=1 Tax=Bdellovibrio svalbardensis TaxID=2972972 RepID=A0ABT6DEG0_9BACT|nr:methyltransferase domain-containing protein [Bdellovibrio svalbardensis]MDG0815211.1 methyltransferase domain-containing protein [Bdellovibrio svalbardensis]
MAIPTQFVQIDEEGYGVSRELRIQDSRVGSELLKNLQVHAGGTLLSTFGGTPVIVEAFDEPLIAQQIYLEGKTWQIHGLYGTEFNFQLESLSLDEWDRFHGYTEKNVPFVMSRKAQAEFFNMLEEFDDESITFDGKVYQIPPYWDDTPEIEKETFWSKSYQNDNNPGWNLGEPAEALKDMLPRLKISRSRILVLGCGEGHDAAMFAAAGHVVTAVDISPLALERAKKLYGHMENLKFMEADLFDLPRSFDKSFDVVFEHTCYCAINPSLRQDLVKVWNRVLADGGHLMGVFFTFEKRQGPPFGGTEWELRQRLKNNYQPIFWGRWQKSVPNRQGKELFIYCTKK